MSVLRDSLRNRGMAFTAEERASHGITGLLPPSVQSLDLQAERALGQLDLCGADIAKYVFLMGLQDRNENLFYKLLVDNVEQMMPLVYTPTVGQACTEFASIMRNPRGVYLSLNDAGGIRKILDNAPDHIQFIVVTDGERILGLGDLGACGMGIPIGKMALYVALAGIDPAVCLPVTIDVGTNNEAFLADKFYIGLRQKRCRTQAYDDLIEEFIVACKDKWGNGDKLLIQWEDFGNTNAFRLLAKYKDRCCTFNDDIQGTAAVALAGILSASKMTGLALKDQKFLFLGAGEAGVGIANLISYAISQAVPCSLEEAAKQIFMVDSKGLVTAERKADLAHHKLAYAHAGLPSCGDFLAAVEALKPTGIIGVSTQAKAFSEKVCKAMLHTPKPIIFALSNPTWKAECTAEEAYTFTDGKCIFASGSPFDPVTLADGRRFVPGQGNNAYIFPGVALGALAVGAKRLDDQSFYLAAVALADQTSDADREVGRVYPPLRDIRSVSAHVAAAVAAHAHATGVASVAPPDDMVAFCQRTQWNPGDDQSKL